MFEELLRNLAVRNGFRLYREQPQRFANVRLDEEWQTKLAAVISNLPQDSGEKPNFTKKKTIVPLIKFSFLAYSKHLCYTNFSKYNLPKPIYVNLVRDPVERIISWFYYERSPK
jgi:dermatan/chondrotin sulfate uronyl 2-O-sulfotransferase UST